MNPIPARLAQRPTYRGMIVPFTVKWFDNVPDFRVTDPQRVGRCLSEQRCGVCGKKLGTTITFIGGILSLTTRMFGDPAMHPDCARYSSAICPFISGRVTEMRTPREDVAIDPQVNPMRTRMGFLFTTGWTTKTIDGRTYIHAHAGRIEWIDLENAASQ